ALGPAGDGMKLAELTVNYRTPEEAMNLAAALLAETAPDLEPPTAIRRSGFAPWSMQTEADALGEVAAGVAAAELEAVGEGRIAVVVPPALRGVIGDALRRGLGDRVATDTSTALERAVSLLAVAETKGLEFDSVVVVEPDAIISASPRGASDLYVALTRTTNRLGVLHTGPLPDALSRARVVTSV